MPRNRRFLQSVPCTRVWKTDGHEGHQQGLHPRQLKEKYSGKLAIDFGVVQRSPLHHPTIAQFLDPELSGLLHVILPRWRTVQLVKTCPPHEGGLGQVLLPVNVGSDRSSARPKDPIPGSQAVEYHN